MSASERRRYARHPIHVPIAIRPRGGDEEIRTHMGNVSEGGLCFQSPCALPRESELEVSFPVGDRRFPLLGIVARSVPNAEDGDLIGIAFLDPQASFRMKLAEQVLRIEELRRELSHERGEDVSEEEAGW